MVLLGPNGSGKSTVFDVFNFLSEWFQFNLRHAWDRRGRAKELKTRGQEGAVVIELKYREQPMQPIITYHLAIDEGDKGPFVAEEWLQWRRGSLGRPFRFLEYHRGVGSAVSGEMPDDQDQRVTTPLRSPDLIAVNTLLALPNPSSKRPTLTNLYSQRPTWLVNAHAALDAAVFEAYGWPEPMDNSEALARLLELNLEREPA